MTDTITYQRGDRVVANSGRHSGDTGTVTYAGGRLLTVQFDCCEFRFFRADVSPVHPTARGQQVRVLPHPGRSDGSNSISFSGGEVGEVTLGPDQDPDGEIVVVHNGRRGYLAPTSAIVVDDSLPEDTAPGEDPPEPEERPLAPGGTHITPGRYRILPGARRYARNSPSPYLAPHVGQVGSVDGTTADADDEGDILVHLGDIGQQNRTNVWVNAADLERVEEGQTPEPVESSTTLTPAEEVVDRRVFWENLDETLARFATREAWCSEYERAVKPLGFSGARDDEEQSERDWLVTVAVRLSRTIRYQDSPVSLDRAIEEHLSDESVELDTFSLEAEFTVTTHVIVAADNEEDATNALDTEMVEGALDSSISYDEIVEWEVGDVEEE